MEAEQQSAADVYSKTVKKFMNEKGWRDYECSECGRTFFSKNPDKNKIVTCGWGKCNKSDRDFLLFSRRKKSLKPSQISAKISEYFHLAGFESVTPRNIDDTHGKTDLIIAGVQMFDNIIHHGHATRKDRVMVIQPCVRMQFQSQVESNEGVSTSFVNICTEQMEASFDEHLQSMDHWCTVLSKLGLHMNDFVIVMRTSQHNWGTGAFSALELFFCYGGLELGDAAYLQIPQLNRPAIPISDIGFGLERIAWATNKTESYFDMLMPLTTVGTREMFDACRTIALLALCGVQAANKGPGLQFRRFAKVLSEKYYGADLFGILPYYFDYWAQFIAPSIGRENAIMLARLEIERFVNLKICNELNLPPPRDETTDAYLDRLMYTCGVSIYELRRVIQICKI